MICRKQIISYMVFNVTVTYNVRVLMFCMIMCLLPNGNLIAFRVVPQVCSEWCHKYEVP